MKSSNTEEMKSIMNDRSGDEEISDTLDMDWVLDDWKLVWKILINSNQNTIFLKSFQSKNPKNFRLRRAVRVFMSGIDDFLISQFETHSAAEHNYKYRLP